MLIGKLNNSMTRPLAITVLRNIILVFEQLSHFLIVYLQCGCTQDLQSAPCHTHKAALSYAMP